jgi:hypothetical protein
MNKTQIIEAIESRNERSAWGRGVKDLAVDLLGNIESDTVNPNTLEADLLNGASDWSQYSYGGCALIYDADIAEALCSPSELKRKDGGRLAPNSRETWLDVQARALSQAFGMIQSIKTPSSGI